MFEDDVMIVYIENLRESTKRYLELVSDYSKATGYKVNIQKSIPFLYINNEQVEFEIKNIISFIVALKKWNKYKSNKYVQYLYEEIYKTDEQQ